MGGESTISPRAPPPRTSLTRPPRSWVPARPSPPRWGPCSYRRRPVRMPTPSPRANGGGLKRQQHQHRQHDRRIGGRVRHRPGRQAQRRQRRRGCPGRPGTLRPGQRHIDLEGGRRHDHGDHRAEPDLHVHRLGGLRRQALRAGPGAALGRHRGRHAGFGRHRQFQRPRPVTPPPARPTPERSPPTSRPRAARRSSQHPLRLGQHPDALHRYETTREISPRRAMPAQGTSPRRRIWHSPTTFSSTRP